MIVWLILIGGSAFVGLLTAIYIKQSWAIYFAGAVPWFCLLAAILYTEYMMPYEGGGASMWPIAQLVGGTVAAVVGIAAFRFTIKLIEKSR